MQLLYNLAMLMLVIVAIPVFIVRTIREEGFGERVRQSFGFLPRHALDPVEKKDCIWLHAASVGEIVAASPLIREFRREFPGKPILVSVVTNSGYAMAKRIMKDADSIIYFPVDLPWLSESIVRRVRPSVFLPVETELWPNFLRATRKYDIPVMMVNGRISDKSVRRYHHLRGVLKDMIGAVSRFCMQSGIDAQYIVRLGADPSLVVVTGNTKFDQTYTDVTAAEKERLLQEVGFAGGGPVILAGSTHQGEEEIILSAFTAVRAEFSAAKLLLAPRDIMRVDDLAASAARFSFTARRRTALKEAPAVGHDVVILDTIGELGKIYSIGDIIYVGGSLVTHGGHNILEPAAHGKAIIVGEHMFNFKETYALFTGRDACITVHSDAELAGAFLRLLHDGAARRAMEEETLRIVRENRGAARKSAQYLKEVLARHGQKTNRRRNE